MRDLRHPSSSTPLDLICSYSGRSHSPSSSYIFHPPASILCRPPNSPLALGLPSKHLTSLVFLNSWSLSQRPTEGSPKPDATSATRGGIVIRPCLNTYEETCVEWSTAPSGTAGNRPRCGELGECNDEFEGFRKRDAGVDGWDGSWRSDF